MIGFIALISVILIGLLMQEDDMKDIPKSGEADVFPNNYEEF